MTKHKPDDFRAALEATLSRFGVGPLTGEQIDLMAAHFRMLCKWNRHINLTRIIEPREAARFHYAESVFGAQFIGDSRRILDIGSGAGFPAIPFAILKPDSEVTALEANQKKSLFLREVRDALGLENLKIANARLESFDWSDFRLLVSRALEGAGAVFPSVIRALRGDQRLMLFCGRDLVDKLLPSAGDFRIVSHQVPMSEDRLVAVFGRK